MSKHHGLSRREFLKRTGRTSAGLAALSGPSFAARPERVSGANDRVRLAIVGLHGRGMDHVHGFSAIPAVEIAAVCDVDENVLRDRLAHMARMNLKPASFVDIRKLLDDHSIDAISI